MTIYLKVNRRNNKHSSRPLLRHGNFQKKLDSTEFHQKMRFDRRSVESIHA